MNPPNYAYDVLDALSQELTIVDKHGTTVFANKAWKDFGTNNGAASDFIGCKYPDFCDYESLDPICALAAKGIKKILDGSSCHSPRQERWLKMTATPLSDTMNKGICIIHDNITERKQAEEKNLLQKDRLSLIVNSIDAALFGVDISLLQQYFSLLKSLHITDLNNRFLEKHGGKRSQYIGKKCYDVGPMIGRKCDIGNDSPMKVVKKGKKCFRRLKNAPESRRRDESFSDYSHRRRSAEREPNGFSDCRQHRQFRTALAPDPVCIIKCSGQKKNLSAFALRSGCTPEQVDQNGRPQETP